MLLDCFSIPCVMLFSWLLLKRRVGFFQVSFWSFSSFFLLFIR